MKNRFAEYYELSEERIKEIWDNSLIVFDTNVLLNLYRYNEDARNEFINVIKFYKKRLWIPYQVGLEFHRRREEIMRKNATAYKTLGDSISEQLVKVIDSLNSDRDYARHPYINMKDIRSKVERCANAIKKSLDQQATKHPDYSQGDIILTVITELFEGRVGEDLTEKELDTLYKEGEKRYANKVPPGYCDEKNKKDKGKRSLYGDLIVWKQTLSHCKEHSKSVIFITDDHKLDWWDKVEGKHTPRKELIKEFSESVKQGILIYDSSRFLEYAKHNKELKVSQKTIKEVEKVKTIDNWWVTAEKLDYIQNAKEYIQNLTSINKHYPNLVADSYKSIFESIPTIDTKINSINDFYKTLESINGLSKTQNFINNLNNLTNSLGNVNINEKLLKPLTIEDLIKKNQ